MRLWHVGRTLYKMVRCDALREGGQLHPDTRDRRAWMVTTECWRVLSRKEMHRDVSVCCWWHWCAVVQRLWCHVRCVGPRQQLVPSVGKIGPFWQFEPFFLYSPHQRTCSTGLMRSAAGVRLRIWRIGASIPTPTVHAGFLQTTPIRPNRPVSSLKSPKHPRPTRTHQLSLLLRSPPPRLRPRTTKDRSLTSRTHWVSRQGRRLTHLLGLSGIRNGTIAMRV